MKIITKRIFFIYFAWKLSVNEIKGAEFERYWYARVGIEEQRLDLKRDAGGQETRFRKDGLPGKRSEHFAIVVEND